MFEHGDWGRGDRQARRTKGMEKVNQNNSSKKGRQAREERTATGNGPEALEW